MIVVGLGYGDEGKGLTTSFLCSQTKNPLVVRFNGGHQAGHTVVYEGKRHVFSSFGSGSLQGVPTYWSHHCTLYPPAFMKEYELLDNPIIYVNPLCPVTTPFDVTFNQASEIVNPHGSVGVGFGATIQRQENHFKLFVQDLFHESVLIQKLRTIAYYYSAHNIETKIDSFLSSVRRVIKVIQLSGDSYILSKYSPIFEGAQGIMLDMDFGFFPNVTRSNTTSKNALQLSNLSVSEDIYYVTRTYLTRHGKGFIPNEKALTLRNNENETNISHEYQGEFRTAELDIDLMNYALTCDNNFSGRLRKNLMITCTDQFEIDILELLSKLNTKFHHVYISKGDSMDDVSLFNQ